MPELAAAGTGTVRPTPQCTAHCARRLPLAPMLVHARQQFPRELHLLPPLSLTPFVVERRGQVSSGGARTPLAARL